MRKNMHMVFRLVVLIGFILITRPAASAHADTQWNVGLSGGSDGIEGFHVSVGDYYHVPDRNVIVVGERGIPDDELPVVFYLAMRAHVSPEVIVDLRLGNMSWMDITVRFGMHPDIYYVPVKVSRQGPPYGRAYGYYKKHPKGDWKKLVFTDADIINQVNLKFLTEHYGYAPEKVMKARSDGKSFKSIDKDIKVEKRKKTGGGSKKDMKLKEEKGKGKK